MLLEHRLNRQAHRAKRNAELPRFAGEVGRSNERRAVTRAREAQRERKKRLNVAAGPERRQNQMHSFVHGTFAPLLEESERKAGAM
jgi:hypothetical protein